LVLIKFILGFKLAVTIRLGEALAKAKVFFVENRRLRFRDRTCDRDAFVYAPYFVMAACFSKEANESIVFAEVLWLLPPPNERTIRF